VRWQAQRDTAFAFLRFARIRASSDAQSLEDTFAAGKAPSSLRFAGAAQNAAAVSHQLFVVYPILIQRAYHHQALRVLLSLSPRSGGHSRERLGNQGERPRLGDKDFSWGCMAEVSRKDAKTLRLEIGIR
jgi:hypothetical protein